MITDLLIPSRHRVLDRILAHCLRLGECQCFIVTRNQGFICLGPKNISPALLRVNKQIYARAQDTLFRVNLFSITLGNRSCMGEEPSARMLDLPCAPTLWSTDFRRKVYQMQHLRVSVIVGGETCPHELMDSMLKRMKRDEVMEMVEGQRDENSMIVQNSIDELCNVLEISDRLREINITLVNIGHLRLRTGQEHRILKPFAKLKNVHRVTTMNVPPNFARIMEECMKRKRNYTETIGMDEL